MKTLSEILIEVDKDPTSVNKIAAWNELIKNKKKYPLVQLKFAKEYLDINTHDAMEILLGDHAEYPNCSLKEIKSIPVFSVGMRPWEYKRIAEQTKFIDSLFNLEDKKDSMMVKIVKKLNRILNWFCKY